MSVVDTYHWMGQTLLFDLWCGAIEKEGCQRTANEGECGRQCCHRILLVLANELLSN